MFVISENEYTEESIKEELERLYIAMGYLNAEHGDMEIAMHLVGAAVAELERIAENSAAPRIRMIHSHPQDEADQ